MYTMSESPSRYEDLVNILPKTRYVHTESPSRHVKNEDSAQRAAPGYVLLKSSYVDGELTRRRSTIMHKGAPIGKTLVCRWGF